LPLLQSPKAAFAGARPPFGMLPGKDKAGSISTAQGVPHRRSQAGPLQ